MTKNQAIAIADKVAEEYIKTGEDPNVLIEKYASTANDNWKQRIVEMTNIAIFEKLAKHTSSTMLRYKVADPYTSKKDSDDNKVDSADIEKDAYILEKHLRVKDVLSRLEKKASSNTEKTAGERTTPKKAISDILAEKELRTNIKAAIYAVSDKIGEEIRKIAARIKDEVPPELKNEALSRLCKSAEVTFKKPAITTPVVEYIAERLDGVIYKTAAATELDEKDDVYQSFDNIIKLSKILSELERINKFASIGGAAAKFLGHTGAYYAKHPGAALMTGLGTGVIGNVPGQMKDIALMFGGTPGWTLSSLVSDVKKYNPFKAMSDIGGFND